MEWIKANHPPDKTIRDWLWTEEQLSVVQNKGIEALLNDANEHQTICLSFDNGYLEEIADRINEPSNIHAVRNAYEFVHGPGDFINKLEQKLSPPTIHLT